MCTSSGAPTRCVSGTRSSITLLHHTMNPVIARLWRQALDRYAAARAQGHCGARPRAADRLGGRTSAGVLRLRFDVAVLFVASLAAKEPPRERVTGSPGVRRSALRTAGSTRPVILADSLRTERGHTPSDLG